MIDNFALALTHGLMMLAIFILLRRDDLDREPSPHDRDAKGKPRRRTDDAAKDRPGA